MATETIEQVLLKATKLKAQEGETRQKYFARLIRATVDLTEDKWKALPDHVQEWVNTGAALMNSKKKNPSLGDIAEFPDAAPAEVKGTDAPAPQDKVAEKPAPAKASPVVADDSKKRGGTAHFRRSVIKNPTWTQGEALDATIAEGFTLSAGTAAVVFYEIRNAMKVAAEEGQLKEEFAAPYLVVKEKKVPAPKPEKPAKADKPAKEKPAKKEEKPAGTEAAAESAPVTSGRPKIEDDEGEAVADAQAETAVETA